MNNSIIISILKGEASTEQKQQFFENCKKDQALKDEYLRLKNLWVLAQNSPPEFQEKHLDELWTQIDKQKGKEKQKLWFVLARYAAVVAIAFGIFNIIHKISIDNNPITVQNFDCPPGSINNIRLNDGSTIKLNSDTEIELKQFKNGNVIASLKGEAYFNVIHNEKRSFIVETDGYQIRDLGTIFNIKARPASNHIVATLIDGAIDILNKDGDLLKVMSPDEQCIINRSNGSVSISQITDKSNTDWVDGKLVFVAADITQVVEKLHNKFGTDIQVVPSDLWSDFQLTATFTNESLVQILDIMGYLNEVKYQIDQGQQVNNQVHIKLYKN
ncbi:MAG: FecR family protein [Carboxylicivirga sp.]|nr:FecR family protein [Carboxylicivirga sp.]